MAKKEKFLRRLRFYLSGDVGRGYVSEISPSLVHGPLFRALRLSGLNAELAFNTIHANAHQIRKFRPETIGLDLSAVRGRNSFFRELDYFLENFLGWLAFQHFYPVQWDRWDEHPRHAGFAGRLLRVFVRGENGPAD